MLGKVPVLKLSFKVFSNFFCLNPLKLNFVFCLLDLSLPVTLRFIRFLVEQLDLKIQVLYDRLVSRLNFSDLKVLLLLVQALAF